MSRGITPFLWFNGQAEQAARFYTSVFKRSSLGKISYYGDAGPGPKGSVLTASFELDGQKFVALNGGDAFSFTPAISFQIHCESQEEVDYYWERLAEGGATNRCGWLTDRFGLSWQVVPDILGELLQSPDTAKAQRVMQAMLRMDRIRIQDLLDASRAP